MPKGLKRTLGATAIALALYSLLGFLIAPGIGLRIANQQLAQYATVPARLERLEFNPFSLEVTLWGLHLGAPGTEQVSFERLYANLQVDSLWRGALHLAAVELDQPRTQLLFDKHGQLNLAQLFALPPSPPVAADAPPTKPFPLRIDSIKLNEGYLHFSDQRPSEPIEFVYNAMNLELKNLSTLPEDNADMTLAALSPEGGRIDWSGNLSLSPIASTGTLKVSGAQMKVFWPYVRDALPLDLQAGVLDLSTDYHLDLAKQTELQLSNAKLSVAPFAIKAPDGRPLVNLARLDISETSVDLAKQQVQVGKIRSNGLETWVAREADGQLDWQKLLASAPRRPATAAEAAEAAAPATADSPPAPGPSASAPVASLPGPARAAAAPQPQVVAAPATPAKPWQVVLKDVQLRDYKVHIADRAQAEPVTLDLAPLNIDVRNFDSLNGSPFALKLDTGLGKQGHISAEGEVNLQPVSARLKVATRDIDLRVAQAYITPFIRLELRSGMLDTDLAVDLKSTAPLAMSITGKAQVDQLHTLDTLKQRDFVKWEHLSVDDLDYEHGDRLSIAKVTLDKPYARFMINNDRTTNIDDLLVPQPDEPSEARAPANARTSAAVAGNRPTTPTAKADRPLGIHIGAIAINDGSANFADFSLRPNFATAIQQLNGQIGTLDNRQTQPAKVDIKGQVDRYAPVTIAGSLNPFDPMSALDIATSFKRVELTTLTPYSGKFAGYRIRKGRLNLDLHYRITKGQLQAENTVVVEQLQLGDKVDSPDAVSLPLKLAIALLKDTDGKISISLPVTGDLNNPQFSVMPIVWQTLRNLVLRAAQAPFKFIGGLIAGGGGGDDLGTVAFAPGSSELDPKAQAALLKLSAALKERPALRLEVEGASAQSSDGPILAERRLQREYQSTYYKMLQRRGDKVPADASALTVPEDEKPPMLEAVYRTRLKQQPPAEWQQLDSKARTAKLYAAVIDSWDDSTPLLRQLGQDRAAAIKDYLVQKTQLGDDRVFFIDASLGQAEKDGSVITHLHLDAE